MFSLEPFRTGGKKKKVSQAEIDELKKNMQKVPEIQEKAEQLQAHEWKKADESLQNQVKQLQLKQENNKAKEKEEADTTRRQRILQRIIQKLS